MKFDSLGCIVREKYEPGHPGNLGDSCAETARYELLNGVLGVSLGQFWTSIGFLRHPNSIWREKDTSADQVLPLVLARTMLPVHLGPRILIPGTRTIMSAGLWAAWNHHYWLLNVVNIIQGWLFNLSWRIADGGKIERSEGKVQDWLNYICVYVFLKRMGKWATLNQSRDRCMKAVRKYYLEGDDWEPNSQWIVDIYEQALRPETQPDGSLR